MTPNALAAALLLSLLAAASASAQGAVPEGPAVDGDEADEAKAPDTRHKIRVLENPYDISSFYRSSDGLVFGREGGASERYPIAGFYRQRSGSSAYGYSQFWSNGYSGGRRGRVPLAIGFRRAIGENGDLFLFAPAILAPMGPLTGVFFDGITTLK
jgi:hypothetical protein